MALNNQELVEVYKKRAKRYDFTAQLYYLIGFREWAYREKAVKALDLKQGDTVVEIGCGTGLNFSLLENEIGREGKIVGVDLTDAMLSRARERVRQNGWSNVEVVQSDAATFKFPQGVDGIISTFALTHVAGYDKVIRAGSEALKPSERFVILDFKMPSNWISRLAPLLVLTVRPFGVTMDLAERHPWEALKKYFADVAVHQLYGGFAYIAVGTSAMAVDCPQGQR
jgi:demethylmenaquinone methyltransferase/2-methoxy-6-polyprenyl-1,4-benzoquinol methylase